MSMMDELTRTVTSCPDVKDSVEALIHNIATEMALGETDPKHLDELVETLKSNTGALAEAVIKNTEEDAATTP